MSITRYDLDANADGYFDDPFMKVRKHGKFILHSDYAALLARHNALVEAVAWLRVLDKKGPSVMDLSCVAHIINARAEVDRLLGEE